MVNEQKNTSERPVQNRRTEVYLGKESDRKYMKEYLELIRKVDPVEIATVPNPVKMSELHRNSEVIDSELFASFVDEGLKHIEQKYGVKIEEVPLEKCYIAERSGPNTFGGFHDGKSLGYQYWHEASFTMTLNSSLFSREMRTIELARNYIHDCLHHSTFRSFRRAFRTPAETRTKAKHRTPEIYREQYGINFRDKDGFSYSSANLTEQVPNAINLNLLMDGVVVALTAEALKINSQNIHPENELEVEMLKEILLYDFNNELLPRQTKFFNSVTSPSLRFIEHWGGEEFIQLVLQAMCTGKLDDIKRYFEEKTGVKDAWEKIFMQLNFKLPENPLVKQIERKSPEELKVEEIFEVMKSEGFVEGTEQYEICKKALRFWNFTYKRDEELVDAKTVDCSTLTSQSHWEGALIGIPFIADSQRRAFSGKTISSFEEMIPGDVVTLFPSLDASPDKTFNHVALYLGKDKSGQQWVLESNSRDGVRITKLEEFNPKGGIKRFTQTDEVFSSLDAEKAVELAQSVPKFGRLGVQQYRVSETPRTSHTGLDLYFPVGTPVFSTIEGKVKLIKNETEDSSGIEIIGNNGLTVRYLMLEGINVKDGDEIKEGEVIGKITNPSDKSDVKYSPIKQNELSHLHLEVEITDESLTQDIPNKMKMPSGTFVNHLYLTKIGELGLPIK